MAVDLTERRWWVIAGAIVVLFALLGALRLNPFCLLEPDSPDYLFTARALATFEGYTEIDHPDRPPHAFRPPGLPLTLVPVVAVFPGNVVAAKAFVLLVSLVALGLFALVAVRAGGPATAIVALLLVATGPYTLLHATEIVSEMPYLAALLATLWIVMREGVPSRRTLGLMAVLLALLPLLRTVGLIWVVALIAVSVARRDGRWRVPLGAALLVNAAWMLRNQRTGVVTYFSGMLHDFRELGFGGYFDKTVDAAVYYGAAWFEVLLPGVFSGPPLYERFLLAPAPTLGGLWGVGLVAGLVLSVFAVAGCVVRYREEGPLVLFYAAGFVAALLVYPPRHERLIWPLVPLVFVYAPVGFTAASSWIAERRRALAHGLAAAAVAFVFLLAAWQTVAAVLPVGVNQTWRTDRSGFHNRVVPPMYYADWRAAGEWLAASAPEGTRVLTRHSDIGLSSGLAQDSVRFEEVSPTELHRRIAALRPRYLALPATRFRWLAPSLLLQGSPVYRFEPVYETGDVLLVEVLPNREGVVHRRSPGLDARIDACRAAVERLPHREDLRRRWAQLLHEAGRSGEALEALAPLASAEALVTTGRIHLDDGDATAALDAYLRAETAPGAGTLTATIARGMANARQGISAAGAPAAERAQAHVERARNFLQAFLFASAWRELERAEALAPGDAQALFLRGVLAERTGRFAEAESAYAALGARGVAPAAEAAAALRRERALLDGVDAPAAEWLQLAANRAGQGMLGRALLLLERAAAHYPDSIEVDRRLAEVTAVYEVPPRTNS